MPIRQLITILVGSAGEPPTIPAIVTEWDEVKDGEIDELVGSHLFRLALGVPEGHSFEHVARPATDEERHAWQRRFDAYREEEGEERPIFMHDCDRHANKPAGTG